MFEEKRINVELVLLMIVAGFICGLIVILLILYRPSIPFNFSRKSNTAASSNSDVLNSLNSKTKWLEENFNNLSNKQEKQNKDFQDLQNLISTRSAQKSGSLSGKTILAEAHTQGGMFTTISTGYSPMGMYVNVRCPESCTLWIDFYSSAKNLGSPASAPGNVNTFGLFVDNADKSIFAQASYPSDGASIPVAINSAINVGPGVHTVDIRAKTSSGTLESDSSSLQVLAVGD